MFSKLAYSVFEESIKDYHKFDSVDQPISNAYPKDKFEHLLYAKNWVDAVQWHYEDIIRDPNIDPVEALVLKRKIDASNQVRTDMVEYIDSYFLQKYSGVKVKENAKINSESPAWAFDRLSILALKIYHMQEEATRAEASQDHRDKCQAKLDILMEQLSDLSTAIDDLLQDIENGSKFMKVYKQMKMYNDDELNPVLYQNKK
ncbi:DUF4254 domain-containing protein [Flavobacterium sp. GT3R68]|uniref:DUF4254 domain-containing protein n=1 Tax=Flavobacterium sp. GT3R68 TaxID=2594437 RepID=UPI000F876E11|nr:DUF4254 domain-containing protein [Flavobacterium sp. GT3R68]RTY95928.1 DUF4254 domain-containing protein [Flavobacterium sp. GSN2]TRW93700.1 DUF4254 domain-containing protein [Flavobacterium sp. GT3R68]